MKWLNKLRLVILLVFSILSISCSDESPENRLSVRISELTETIESRDVQVLKSFLATDFSAGPELNKARFIIFVNYQLKRNKNILVSLSDVKERMQKESADVEATVLLLGAEGWLPERAQQYIVESRWVYENDDWYISRLRWRIKS